VAQQSSVPIVESVLLTADLTAGDGSASVRVEYRLSGGAPDTAVPIQLLGFDEATTDQVRVGDRDPVVLWPTSGTLRAAMVRPWASEASEYGRFVVEYDIREAVEESGNDFLVRIPVVVAGLTAGDARDEFFRASVRLPAEWRVADGFPSGFRPDADAHSVSLSVLPAVLRLQGTVDGSWRLGLPLLVDVLVVSILLAFAFFGWLHLRRIAA